MLRTTTARINEMAGKLDLFQENCHDEKLWTWLAAALTCSTQDNDILRPKQKILELFTRHAVNITPVMHPWDLWFESMPVPPRLSVDEKSTEGGSHIDLALGNVRLREGTEGSIEYNALTGETWVCFVEAKLFSDCSIDTTHDPFRNQLTRVIENLLCFQDSTGLLPDRLIFTLLTPEMYRLNWRSRFYGHKFFEYKQHPELILDDICRSLSFMPKRFEPLWKYPDLRDRLSRLTLNWVAHEEVFREFGLTVDFEEIYRKREQYPVSHKLREVLEAGKKCPGCGPHPACKDEG